MRKLSLSLAALLAVSVGAAGVSRAAPLGTTIEAPLTATVVPGAAIQTVQYYGYGRPGYYYHHHWRRWHRWHYRHYGY